MAERIVNCSKHGRNGIGLACAHIAHAIDTGEKVGFFWQEVGDTGRPDAWCRTCEAHLIEHGDTEEWFSLADFKILCVGCWDEAKASIYDGA